MSFRFGINYTVVMLRIRCRSKRPHETRKGSHTQSLTSLWRDPTQQMAATSVYVALEGQASMQAK